MRFDIAYASSYLMIICDIKRSFMKGIIYEHECQVKLFGYCDVDFTKDANGNLLQALYFHLRVVLLLDQDRSKTLLLCLKSKGGTKVWRMQFKSPTLYLWISKVLWHMQRSKLSIKGPTTWSFTCIAYETWFWKKWNSNMYLLRTILQVYWIAQATWSLWCEP